MKHYSVMLNECINNLNIKSDGIYVDGTLGLGGHSSEILKHLTTGHLYAFDEDEMAIDYAKERLSKINNNFTLIKSNFANMTEELKKHGIEKVDGILFDFGVSSPQIDNPDRGFSFMHDGTLDMRMDRSTKVTAADIVNTYSESKLTEIFYKYGEEKKSKFIAQYIVKNRPITTTLELVDVINDAVGNKYFNLNHPERRIFQALRIEVNQELKVIETVLPQVIDLLKPEGRCAIITFHSLEDRIVKQFFKTQSEVNELVKGLPEIPLEYKPKIKLITKKPLTATKEELQENSRSKSAKLRVIERI